MQETTAHIGRKIQRIRELYGMKQAALAAELGISQSAVTDMEHSDTVDEERLQKVAAVLGISPEAIKNFSEEALVFSIYKTCMTIPPPILTTFNAPSTLSIKL